MASDNLQVKRDLTVAASLQALITRSCPLPRHCGRRDSALPIRQCLTCYKMLQFSLFRRVVLEAWFCRNTIWAISLHILAWSLWGIVPIQAICQFHSLTHSCTLSY